MVNVIIVKNPFKPEQHETQYMPFKKGKPVSHYHKAPGEWVYSINGHEVTIDTPVNDHDYIVVMPKIEGKFFGVLLSIGMAVFTGGIASGAIFGIQSLIWRTVLSMAIGMIGNAVISKLTAPKVDRSNSEQSTTYGWGGTKTVTGQGYPLAVTYGRMKSAGMLLSRHVISDGDKQYLNLLYCAGEGELSKIEDIRINSNPISNYKDVQVDIRLGTNDQTVIPNFNDNFADQGLNYELKNEWSVQQVQGDACDAIELTIGFPNGLYYSNDSGGMDKTSVTVDAEIRKVGTQEWQSLPLSNNKGLSGHIKKEPKRWFFVDRDNKNIANSNYTGYIREATNSAFYRVFRFDNLDKAKYEVRMRCSGKDGTSLRHVNKVYWTQLTQIIYDDFVHPGKALIGIKALATSQLSGSDPDVSWIQERSKVWAFNPYNNQYEEKPADNPAWAAYDLLHVCRKIGSEYIVFGQPQGRIDYDAFNTWAEKCTLNKFTFNYIFDTATRLWDALKYPEAVGRGKVIPAGTRFTCVSDYQSSPVQLFTVANIKYGSFTEEFQGVEARANSIELSFINKDKDYERDVIPVYGDTYDESNSLTNPAQIELMGCTSLEQAYRHGKHYLRCNKYEIRTVTFEAFTDAIACTVGDIILVQHDVPEWGEGGRVVAVNGQTITLDKEVTTQPGKQYQLLVRNNTTDAVSTYNVANVSGLNVIVQETIPVQKDCIYAFGEISKAAKPFRVLAITEGHSEMTRKIQCMEYYPELYAADDGHIPTINYANHSASDIQDIGLVSDVYGANGIMYSRIAVSWQLPRDGKVTNVVVNYRNTKSDTWTYVGNFPSSANGTTISDVLLGANYEVRVQAINDLGQLTTGVTKSINIPKMQAPEDVQNLHVLSRYNQTADKKVYYDLQVLFDKPSNPANFDVAEVWYMLTAKSGKPVSGQEWQYAGSSTSQVIIKSLGPGETYRIKAISVDRFGNRAETAQVVDVEVKPMDAIPDMPKNFTISFDREAKAKWDEVLNADVDYYELRTDNNPGNDYTALLARVKGTTATLTLTKRADTVYLFAKSTLGKYSTPARYEYNLPQLDKPEVVAKSTINGINLYFSAKPAQAYAIRCHVVGDTRTDDLETTSTMLTYSNEPGIYTVRCAFVDVFGEGKLDEQMVTIKATIPKEMLDREALGLAEFDKRVNELSEEFNKVSHEYSTKVQNLAADVESRFTQLDNGIELKVKEGLSALNGKEIVNRLNIGTNGIRLDGKLFHVTAETLFDNNIITNKMLQANAITADKLKVDSLSALSAYIGGTLRGGKLIGTEIQNESGTFKVDAQGNIKGANITGSRIDANSVFAEGQQLKPAYVKRIDVTSGDKIEIPPGYSWDKTLIFLRWASDPMEQGRYEYSGTNMSQTEINAIQQIAQERFRMTINMRNGWSMNGFGGDLLDKYVTGKNEDIASRTGGRFISFNQGRPVYGVVQYSGIVENPPPVFKVTTSAGAGVSNKPAEIYGLGITEKGYFYYGKMSARQGGWGRAGITIMSFW
ncbi:host specificity factor TipJ family phage tail protein [Veillonella sp.]|uniref:host specificity factor TipJ family phage tail protein n=1 Tax=Veillonella sp. TaxID=1926307 RepID=UPI0035A017E7